MTRSRYRPDAPPDYSHRFHAGNVGDVWKHCVLAEVLRGVGGSSRLTYVESHAGEGSYRLASTGEWTEGIGRLWRVRDDRVDRVAASSGGTDAVSRYVDLVRRLGSGDERPETYPGSPVLARALLGSEARLVLHEQEPDAFGRLERELAGDPYAQLHCDDGLAALTNDVHAAEADGSNIVALVDPPYGQKRDWRDVTAALTEAATASKRARLLLWYPVKSLTRPNAMRAELESAGVAATLLELITTPLEHQRQRLNGSGVILVRPPAGAVEALAAAAAVLGPRCATRSDTWWLRVLAWAGR
ncbi:MAG: 23S rRNA (adenine(2030)-N(6))-methyltransferase RlmJ [Deltaproteobacteria bacterium]|nr:23S rRNA (adenine(2030)-N(6))-methyltransferase RlmJ [Deltaproteobacteria bacterium]